MVWWVNPPLGWTSLVLMLASAALHTAYYMLLDRGYRSGGDLSLVYPLARGSGPLITVLVAVLLLNERPSGVALIGALLIGCGAVLLTGNLAALRSRGSLLAVGYALLTGGMIAALMGTHLLREGDVARRLTAATAMVAGITCLALG